MSIMGKYDDIINLPHHVSEHHKPMPMANRAAQFAPFAALSGHDDAIAETMRLTEAFKELSEDEINLLSRKLKYSIENRVTVEIKYFVHDKTKTGGKYKRVKGKIKKWEEFDHILLLEEGETIQIESISGIKILDNDEFSDC